MRCLTRFLWPNKSPEPALPPPVVRKGCRFAASPVRRVTGCRWLFRQAAYTL